MTKKSQHNKNKSLSLLLLKSRQIGAGQFKARCLQLMDEVERSGVEIVITKHRRPVARLIPARERSSGFCGSMAGLITKQGDLVSPIDVHWEADESNLA